MCTAKGSDVRPGVPWSPPLLRDRRGTMCTAKGSDVRPGVPWSPPLLRGRLSKLKSGERLTPPKANVCDEHVYGAMRACGARVRCAIYARSDACSARYTRAITPLLEHIRCIYVGSRLLKTPALNLNGEFHR